MWTVECIKGFCRVLRLQYIVSKSLCVCVQVKKVLVIDPTSRDTVGGNRLDKIQSQLFATLQGEVSRNNSSLIRHELSLNTTVIMSHVLSSETGILVAG